MEKYTLTHIKRKWVPNWLYAFQAFFFNLAKRITGERDTFFTEFLKWAFNKPV